MRKQILNNTKVLASKNKKVKFDYNMFIDSCKKIAEDIKSKYDLENDDIELIGTARGALPMLVTLSHLLNVRRVSVIQTQMSNSDDCHDFGDFRLLSDTIDPNKKKCILFEDIIFRGTTVDGVLNVLKERDKEVLSVYTFVIDEQFKDITLNNNDIDINYIYEIAANDWVYFFWETDIREID